MYIHVFTESSEKQTHLSWLKKEVEILEMCLSHPNIISLLTVEEKPGEYSQVTEAFIFLHPYELHRDKSVLCEQQRSAFKFFCSLHR